MRRCHAARELLPALIDNELDAPRRVPLEQHLAACDECRAAFDALQKDDRLLRAAIGAPVPTSDRINEGVWRRIQSDERAREAARPAWPARLGVAVGRMRLPRVRAWAFGGGLAAAALLLLVLTQVLRPQMGPMDVRVASVAGAALWHPADAGSWQPLSSGAILHAGDRLKTADNGQLTALWRDGSRATVGPYGEGSVLHLLPGMEIRQGRVYFDVKKRPSRDAPFTVRSPQATAQVLGTRFQVDVMPDRRATVLAVYHGAVHLFNMQGSVVAREWTSTQAIGNAPPTLPQTISPLSPSAMWWIRR